MLGSIGTTSCSGRTCRRTAAEIPGKLETKLNADLGGVQKFKDDFKAAAVGQFGSGWAWLVQGSDGKLKITKTPNGSNPLATGEGTALLGIDVWEHSYYLDFRNRRPDYVSNWLDKIANYEYAASKLKSAHPGVPCGGPALTQPSPVSGRGLRSTVWFTSCRSQRRLITIVVMVSRSTVTRTLGAMSTSISSEPSLTRCTVPRCRRR